jgi:hypothetical protein
MSGLGQTRQFHDALRPVCPQQQTFLGPAVTSQLGHVRSSITLSAMYDAARMRPEKARLMKLHVTLTSPYARLARILVVEKRFGPGTAAGARPL